jgi:hypothetical protein
LGERDFTSNQTYQKYLEVEREMNSQQDALPKVEQVQ